MRAYVFLASAFIIFLSPISTNAQYTSLSTTTLTVSICGNSIVDDGEECDAIGETGVYSQTIIGRQCTPSCNFGPYCGDGILQTVHSEQCDDGNNDSGDFCSATCTIEPAGSGGGGSSGGGSSGGGGSTKDLGDTVINIVGKAYPSRTINFILDSENVGTVRSGSDGRFEFSTDSSPGTVTFGIWSTDINNVKSITLNNTFDVTQGAITNLNGVILPPTISVSKQNVNPSESITISGQSVPNATVQVHFDNSAIVETATAQSNGVWSLNFPVNRLSVAEHIIRARSITGTPPLTTQSSFSTSLQLFVGVNGKASLPSDLNRDSLINLIDFSILIFWWNTAGGNSNPPADINANGRVGLEDFSILLFNWTG